MKNIKAHIRMAPLILLSFLCFIACDENEELFSSDIPMNNQTSRITVNLTDAPGDYDEVNLEIVDVLIKSDLSQDDSGWVSIGFGTEPILLNVLSLTGGVNALIADAIVPSGNLGQIRLLLGANNYVIVDGQRYELETPSAQQSGLKLVMNRALNPDEDYEFTLDFDVDKSIVKIGNPVVYSLHPVIRVFTEDNTGEIEGSVNLVGYQVKVTAMMDGNNAISGYTNALGEFKLKGVSAGIYSIVFTPDPASNYLETAIHNVVMTNSETNDLGTIFLSAN